MREIISQTNDGVTIQVASEAPEGFFTLLDQTVWGTEGMLYIMHDLQAEVAKLPQPYYVAMSENNEVIATMLLSKKTVFNFDEPCDVYYAALVAVRPDRRNQGIGTRLVGETTRYLLATTHKCVIYAHVEEENEPSQNVFQKVGFDVIGDFSVPVHNRLSPKPDPRVSLLKPEEASKMINRLQKQYKGFALVDFNQSFDPEAYYVLKDNGAIIAGLQVHPFHWTITSLQGWTGRLLLTLLPKTPILNRLFNPADYRFLKIGNIYTLEGREEALTPLIQSLLNSYHVNSCFMYINTRHPNYQRITQAVKHGPLGSIETKAFVFAYNQGLSEDEYAQMQQGPLNISIIDSI